MINLNHKLSIYLLWFLKYNLRGEGGSETVVRRATLGTFWDLKRRGSNLGRKTQQMLQYVICISVDCEATQLLELYRGRCSGGDVNLEEQEIFLKNAVRSTHLAGKHLILWLLQQQQQWPLRAQYDAMWSTLGIETCRMRHSVRSLNSSSHSPGKERMRRLTAWFLTFIGNDQLSRENKVLQF